MDPADRCPWAVKFGVTLTTRCMLDAGHGEVQSRLGPSHVTHKGRGLAEFQYQRIEWLPGDPREFETKRTDTYAWEDLGSYLSKAETVAFNETMGGLAGDVALPFVSMSEAEE